MFVSICIDNTTLSQGLASKSSIIFHYFLGCDHLREVFYAMGLSDKDIVALSGAHTLVCFISSLASSNHSQSFY